MQIKISITKEGYSALINYMATDPQKYRTVSECVADLAGIGIEAITGQRVKMTGAGWGGKRSGSGRKVTK